MGPNLLETKAKRILNLIFSVFLTGNKIEDTDTDTGQ